MYARKMLRLIAGEDLDVIKVIQSANGATARVPGGGVVSEGRYYVEGFEHVAREIGGVGSGSDAQGDVVRFCAVKD